MNYSFPVPISHAPMKHWNKLVSTCEKELAFENVVFKGLSHLIMSISVCVICGKL